MYLEQRMKIQILVRKEIYSHEWKITSQYKENKGGRKKMWEYNEVLIGENQKEEYNKVMRGGWCGATQMAGGEIKKKLLEWNLNTQ